MRGKTVEIVSAVTAFDHDHVVLSDGSRIAADTVICATGYHPNLAELVGHLGVLTPEGLPTAQTPTPTAKGLYFHGLLSRPSLMGYLAKQSRVLARRICAES